jgi:hypothetical protein
MLFIIIAFIAGIVTGQWVYLSIDPKLIELLGRAWSSMVIKLPQAKEAIMFYRMGPLQQKIHQTFQSLDSEAKAKEVAIDAKAQT